MKTVYVVGIVLAVVVVVAIITRAVVIHVVKKKKREDVLKTCSTADGNTIFVSIVSIADPTGAGSTLHSIFKEAQCPLRVYIGMCEIYDDSAPHTITTAVDVYKDLCTNSTSPFCLTDNIRVLRVPLSEAHGTFAAREHIERYLYRSETYVATVACPVAVSKNWDEHCIAALAQLDCPTAVLTTQLGSPASGSPCVLTQPGTYIGVTGTTAVLVHSRALTVPTLGGFRIKHVPTYRDGADEQAVHVLPSIAWCSSFSFSYGARIDSVPFPRNGTWAVDALEDVIMTCRFLQAGWTLHCLTGCVGHSQSQKWNANAKTIDGLPPPPLPELCDDFARASCITSDAMKSLGIVQGRVSARARLGLSKVPSEHELRGKIGSTTEYLSLLARIDLTSKNEK